MFRVLSLGPGTCVSLIFLRIFGLIVNALLCFRVPVNMPLSPEVLDETTEPQNQNNWSARGFFWARSLWTFCLPVPVQVSFCWGVFRREAIQCILDPEYKTLQREHGSKWASTNFIFWIIQKRKRFGLLVLPAMFLTIIFMVLSQHMKIFVTINEM